MNIQEYIESGVLELYVIGTLSPEESREVERLAEMHPEIREELSAIEATVEGLTAALGQQPRPELRRKVISAVEQEATGQQVELPSSPAVRAPGIVGNGSNGERSTVFPMQPPPPKRASRSYLMAASWVLLAISLGAALFMGYQWRTAEQELAAARVQKDSLMQQIASMEQRSERATRVIALLDNPTTKMVDMKGTEHAPDAHAMVVWDPRSKEVHLMANNLPVPPDDRQYQLWAIDGDQKIDAGVFDVGPDAGHMQQLKSVGSAQAFAVTLEPKGGRPTPSPNSMYALGKL